MAEETSVSSAMQKQIIAYLAATPKATALLATSFLSGHLWVFIITAFLRSKTRGNKLLEKAAGRTALGILWHGAVLVPIYFLKYRQYDFDYDKILAVVIPTIVAALFLQMVLFAAFAYRGDHK